ncbi:zinc-binding alcohol dehydrogenase family protein [Angustibacter luteus]|uniref:Zinc-binding alcohol dehydrogenase family protein n=1 Tax=Angustibacter luteus TaxID=658456 RepID=A0ABW1JDX7_9ACTN
MRVNAAVVRSFDEPPHHEGFDLPDPTGADQAVVDVLAAGLHPRVRSGASGRHYTSTGRLPLVPGIDGVGRLADGRLVYFVTDDDLPGSMAARAVIDTRRMVVLPEDVDVVRVAAAMNPAMSSWVALRRRVPIEPGQSVLVLGATGNAGQMAVQVAKRLGAGRVVGAGRNPAALALLAGLGADVTVALGEDDDAAAAMLAAAASEVDLVLDYLWAAPAASAMMALLRARADRSRALDWIQIGSVAGPTLELPSVALRSANLRIQGNGQGAVSTRAYVAELPSLVEEISSGRLAVNARAVPLADVEAAWTASDVPGVRTVLQP